jgi:hypothetical protein
MNTTLAASSSGLMTLLLGSWLGGTYDLRLCCNGVLSGLVTVTAMCGFVDPYAAVVGGVVAGACYIGFSRLMVGPGPLLSTRASAPNKPQFKPSTLNPQPSTLDPQPHPHPQPQPQTKLNQPNHIQTTPNQTKPIKPNPTKPNQPNPTQPNPTQPKPNQTKPNQTKPNPTQTAPSCTLAWTTPSTPAPSTLATACWAP